jgi:sugar transferase EpsL
VTKDHSQQVSQRSRRRPEKRLFDLVLTFMALPLAVPLFLFIALTVRGMLGSPILFRQQRPGLYRTPFTLLKFRTMTDARDREGQLLPDSQRLTCVGRFLRSTSLDELPELLNVLKGDMSLVGPRPLLMEYLAHYTPEQQRRHLVPPGLTGWAQVNGRNTANWQQRFLLDLWYVEHHSMWLDCKILLMTPWKVFKREGMMHPDDPSWEGNFKGASSDRPSR